MNISHELIGEFSLLWLGEMGEQLSHLLLPVQPPLCGAAAPWQDGGGIWAIRIRRCLNCRYLNLPRWALPCIPSYLKANTKIHCWGWVWPNSSGPKEPSSPSPSPCPALCTWKDTIFFSSGPSDPVQIKPQGCCSLAREKHFYRSKGCKAQQKAAGPALQCNLK